MKLYIAILDEFPDQMVPVLTAHAMLGAHIQFSVKEIQDDWAYPAYIDWVKNSFRKCVVRVNQREFDKIAALPACYLGYESSCLDGRNSCAIPLPYTPDTTPNVLRFAKLWKPKYEIIS